MTTPDDARALTLEFFWIFARPFGSQHELRGCIEIIEALPGVTWQRYDQDTMALWKPWTPERALVDAQTQRTAMLRAEGSDGAMAVLALGKRGEPPTLLLRYDFQDIGTARTFFEEATERVLAQGVLKLVRAGVAPVAARNAYHRALPGMNAVGRFEVPAWLSVLRREDDLLAGTETELVTRRELDGYVLYELLPDVRSAPDDAVEHWKALAQLVARSATPL